jgi:hypothetical protein
VVRNLAEGGGEYERVVRLLSVGEGVCVLLETGIDGTELTGDRIRRLVCLPTPGHAGPGEPRTVIVVADRDRSVAMSEEDCEAILEAGGIPDNCVEGGWQRVAQAQVAVAREAWDYAVLCVRGALVGEDPDRTGNVALRFRKGLVLELPYLPHACDNAEYEPLDVLR